MNLIVPDAALRDGRLVLIADSYRRLTGRDLLHPDSPLPQTGEGLGERDVHVSTLSLQEGGNDSSDNDLRRALWQAPHAIVAHGTGEDPVFFYGNRIALQLFEMSFAEFARLPSRLSAEPVAQEAREQALAKVAQQGYVEGYAGVRISGRGRRFRILDTTIWNLVDETGKFFGQAAVIGGWEPV